MGCLAALLALISPRLALVVVFIFTGWIGAAFAGWFVPLLGFLLLPWATLAYVLMYWAADGNLGFEWFIVILAFVLDLGSYAKSDVARRGF